MNTPPLTPETAAPAPPALANGHANAPDETVRMIGVNELHPSDANPRTHFDESKLKELADSILQQGIVEPLVVRRGRGASHEIVAGERRWRAARMAGYKQVPCIVREISDAHAARMMAVENLQRVDLTPIEEARAFQAWLAGADKAKDGNAVLALARSIGKSDDYVRERMWLLKLTDKEQALVEAGRITVKAALLISRINDEKMRRDLVDSARDGELTPSEVRNHLSGQLIDLFHAPFEFSKAMPPAGPACDGCQHRKFRDGSMMLPALDHAAKKDLGVRIKTACYLAKAQLHFEAKGYQVHTNEDELGKKHKNLTSVSEHKKGCSGCEQRLIVLDADRYSAGEKQCTNPSEHYDWHGSRSMGSAEDKARFKKERERVERARKADIEAKESLLIHYEKLLERGDRAASDMVIEAIAASRMDLLRDVLAILRLKGGKTRQESMTVLRQAWKNTADPKAGIVVALAYFIASKHYFMTWGRDAGSAVGLAKKLGLPKPPGEGRMPRLGATRAMTQAAPAKKKAARKGGAK